MKRRVRTWGARYLGLGVAIAAISFTLVMAPRAVATGDANTAPGESCPNEASPDFRTYLPDCRAYELVTPPYKDGSEPEVDDVSEDGAHVVANSLGAFAGTQSDTEAHGSEYELSRSPSGWAASAISPPASSFPAQALVATSPELADSLWLARTPAESDAAENLYVREADGSMTEIGPTLPPSVVAGAPAGGSASFEYFKEVKFMDASDDFSRVFFEIDSDENLKWPGDPTIRHDRSLYEYTGREQTRPELVGVSDGSTVVNKEKLAAGQLISDCETNLGSYDQNDLYNAVSDDGGTVFFTAVGHNSTCGSGTPAPEVNELYARVGSVQTVPISEPSAGACAICNVPATASEGREEGIFAGASADGSKVFFLTEQELLPGAKGENLYEYDFDNPEGNSGTGRIVRVSSGSETPEVLGVARVSEDGSHVYFVAQGVLTGSQANEYGAVAQVGENNLYVFERDSEYPEGRLTFIATLVSESAAELKEAQEACSGAEEEACEEQRRYEFEAKNRVDEEDWLDRDERPVQATPNGRFLVFESMADLTPGDTGAVPQIFEYDAEPTSGENEANGELVRVSRGSSTDEAEGTASANANASTIHRQKYTDEEVSPAQPATHLALSADGATVVFESKAALTEEAEAASAADANSVYEYHSTVAADAGYIGDGNVYLISDGTSVQGSTLTGIDASGEDVFLLTADPLVPQDNDTQFDLYDARADGGFPGLDPPPACSVEACLAPSLGEPPGPLGSEKLAAAGPALAAPAVAPSSAPVGDTAAKTAEELRAKKLAKARKACKRKPKAKRRSCEAEARRRYGPRSKATTKTAAKETRS